MESGPALDNLQARLESADNPQLNRFFTAIAAPAAELDGQDVDIVRDFLQNKGVLNVFRVIWHRRMHLARQLLGGTDMPLDQIRRIQGRVEGLLEAIALFTLVFEDQEEAVEEDNGRPANSSA